MSKRRTALGDTVVTTYGKTSTGDPVEHIEMSTTQTLKVIDDSPGHVIYDDKPKRVVPQYPRR